MVMNISLPILSNPQTHTINTHTELELSTISTLHDVLLCNTIKDLSLFLGVSGECIRLHMKYATSAGECEIKTVNFKNYLHPPSIK